LVPCPTLSDSSDDDDDEDDEEEEEEKEESTAILASATPIERRLQMSSRPELRHSFVVRVRSTRRWVARLKRSSMVRVSCDDDDGDAEEEQSVTSTGKVLPDAMEDIGNDT
jgi:hypothetical protein